MASNLDRERFLDRIGINLEFTRVSGIFKPSTSFPCYETFSAPLGARKCLSPISKAPMPVRSCLVELLRCLLLGLGWMQVPHGERERQAIAQNTQQIDLSIQNSLVHQGKSF